jgi:hypothetical protein
LLTGAVELEDQEENDDEPSFTPAIEEVYFDEIACPPPETGADELLRIDGPEFVRRFSKINICTNQVLAGFGKQAAKDALVASVYSGNSRDQVSLWQFSCKNVTFGCSYQHSFYSQVLEHQRTCKIISTEALAELNEVKAFPCDRDGCVKSFNTNARRNSHIAEVHDWKPRACNKDGCDPSYVFQSRAEHSRHVEHVHSPYASTKCQYPGCTSQVSFATSKTYRAHLLSIHGLTDRKEKDKYMPGKKPSFVRQKCRLAGCTYNEKFTQASKLRAHLVLKHGYTNEAVESYMS